MLKNRVLNNIKLNESVPLDCYLDDWYSSQPKKAVSLKDAVLVGVIIKEQFPSLFKLIIEAKEQNKAIDHDFITKLIEIDLMINGQSKCFEKAVSEHDENPKKNRATRKNKVTEPVTEHTGNEKTIDIPPLLTSIGK